MLVVFPDISGRPALTHGVQNVLRILYKGRTPAETLKWGATVEETRKQTNEMNLHFVIKTDQR